MPDKLFYNFSIKDAFFVRILFRSAKMRRQLKRSESIMKKKFLQLFGIFSTVVFLTGCAKPVISPSENPSNNQYNEMPIGEGAVNMTEGSGGLESLGEPTEAEEKALSNASVKVFLETIKKESDEKNVLLSPTSLMFALGMTENGANGQTLEEMENTMNGGISIEELNRILSYTANHLESSEDVEWNVADSIWVRDEEGLKLNQDFLNKVVSYYCAEIWKAPFDQSTVDDINNWVNNNTKGMIPEILDQIPADAVMYLVNAIAFEGEWEEQYSEDDIYENEIFHNADGSTTTVTMLRSEENRYFELAGGEGFIKTYKGGEYAFVGILPEEGMTTKEYINKLAENGEDFSKAIREAEFEEVIVNMPEFTNDYEKEMSSVFAEAGMPSAFHPETADFTNMFAPDENGYVYEPYIGRILHKTHIEVDREGTKAAAVTVVEMKCEAVMEMEEPLRITLDRPFVYAIVDTTTGLPIFLGCQNTME